MAPTTMMRALGVAAVAAAAATSLARAQAPGPEPSAGGIGICGDCTFEADASGTLSVSPADAACICESLVLEELGITTLTPGVFDKLNATYLSLEDNDIDELPVGIFNLATVSEISVAKNSIGPVLDGGVFSNLANLEKLWLYKNNIVNITDAALAGLSALKFLDPSQNLLTSWRKEITADTSLLDFLSINNNNIASWTADAFSTVPIMNDLRLDINPFTELPADLLVPIGNLTQLEIDVAQLTSIPDTFFTPVLGTLLKLQMGDNPLAPPAFPPQVKLLTKLNVLDMENLALPSAPNDAFTAMTDLKTLKLSGQAEGFCVWKSALPPQWANLTSAELEEEIGAPSC